MDFSSFLKSLKVYKIFAFKMDYYPESESDGFDKKSKKKGRKGNFDESRDVDKDTYDYFQRVMENLETQEFEDEEEKCKGVLKRGPCTCSTFKAYNLTYLHILR